MPGLTGSCLSVVMALQTEQWLWDVLPGWPRQALDAFGWARLDLASPGPSELGWPDPALVGPWLWSGVAIADWVLTLAVSR